MSKSACGRECFRLGFAVHESGRGRDVLLVVTPMFSRAGSLIAVSHAGGWENCPVSRVNTLPGLIELVDPTRSAKSEACWVLRDTDGNFDFVVGTGPATFELAPVVPIFSATPARTLRALADYFPQEVHIMAQRFSEELPRT